MRTHVVFEAVQLYSNCNCDSSQIVKQPSFGLVNINWLQCDSCKELYFFDPEMVELAIMEKNILIRDKEKSNSILKEITSPFS